MQNVLIACYYFLPVWAFIIWWIPIKGKLVYVLTEIFLLALTVQLAYSPFRMNKITWWMHYYTFAIMLYILILGYKNHYTKFPKVLASALWMVFIAGDFWEIPIFTYDIIYLNGWNSLSTFTVWVSSHIHRVYVLASFLLFATLTKFKFNRDNLTILALSFGGGFILLHPFYRTLETTIMTRIITLAAFGAIIYSGIKHDS